MGKSVEALSAPERIAYYRGMAAESVRLAATASNEEMKASYLDNASRWRALATEVEHLEEHLASLQTELGEIRRAAH